MHQFDKVEMFSFVAPEDSVAEHERILAIEEEILGELGLPYRVVNIAVNDLGNSAAKKYDCEAWLPSQERYRELTSCSNTTDYQARRLNIRMRAREGHADAAHAQRHRRRRRAHDRRAARERPAGGRQRRAAGGARALRRAGALVGVRHGPVGFGWGFSFLACGSNGMYAVRRDCASESSGAPVSAAHVYTFAINQ